MNTPSGCVRDGGRHYGPNVPTAALRDRIGELNCSIIHSGYAIVDAFMLKEREHKDLIDEFKEPYGLEPG